MNSCPSIGDIAAAAGLSRYTVSLALRRSARVPAATRERVENAARDLGYRPNPTLSALMRSIRSKSPQRRLTSLALILPRAASEQEASCRYLDDIHRGVRARCETLGFAFERFTATGEKNHSRHLQNMIEARGIDGVIIGPRLGLRTPLGLDFSRLAYVAIGRSLVEVPAHRVEGANYANMNLALASARARGWVRPGLILSDLENEALENMRLGAYVGFMRHQGVRTPEVLVCPDRDLTAPTILDWVDRQRVDCVFASRRVVLQWLREGGYDVGVDLGFAHLDCAPGSTEFSGIDQRLGDVGAAAVDFLGDCIHDNLRGVPEIPRVLEIEGRWQDGPTLPSRPAPEPERAAARVVKPAPSPLLASAVFA